MYPVDGLRINLNNRRRKGIGHLGSGRCHKLRKKAGKFRSFGILAASRRGKIPFFVLQYYV